MNEMSRAGYVDPKTRIRFLAKTRRNGDCWEWTGWRRAGYGGFAVGSRRDGSRRDVPAHRFAYELFIGPIPAGMTIDHLCRNRACVNAAHLEPVTNRENILRGTSPAAERAQRTHCPKGHSDYMIRQGRRTCRVCYRYSSNEMRVERRRRQRARERECPERGRRAGCIPGPPTSSSAVSGDTPAAPGGASVAPALDASRWRPAFIDNDARPIPDIHNHETVTVNGGVL